MVPRVGFELTTYRLPSHFGFRRLAFVVWTIPSPWHRALGVARLVSTPSPDGAWLGIGLAFGFSFPRIWAILLSGFPPRHSYFLRRLLYQLSYRGIPYLYMVFGHVSNIISIFIL